MCEWEHEQASDTSVDHTTGRGMFCYFYRLSRLEKFLSIAIPGGGVHYIYFGYGDVPSGRVSIVHILVYRTVSISQC